LSGRKWKYEWSEEKINAMKKYYPLGEYELLFEILGHRDIDSLRYIAKKLGLKSNYYYFSKADIEFIKNNFEKIGYKKIASILNRTEGSIESKAIKLGLTSPRDWSVEEIKLLKEKYPHYTNDYLSRKIFPKRTLDSINLMACKLGIKKSEEQNNKIYDKCEMLEELVILANKLNRTPLVEELVIYGLASNKTYERYFDGYQNACRLAGLEPNYDLWGRAKVFYSSRGDVCFSNAELIVTEFLINNNILYNKDVLYSKIVLDDRCGTKRTDWVLEDKTIVEYWGYPKVEDYIPNMNLKIQICKDNNIKLIEINRKDLTKLHKVFGQYL
jgi:hypothetical protein